MTENRYFLTSDPKAYQYGPYRVPPVVSGWYFRPYEYHWAVQHIRAVHSVLDAGSGVSHWFKYYLSIIAREVVAVDCDPRIETTDRQRKLLPINLQLQRCDIAGPLPFPPWSFDRIVCVSVFEHLQGQTQIGAALSAFAEVLKPDTGRVLVTFDAPRLNPAKFARLVADSPLAFLGDVETTMPPDAITRGQLAGGEPDGYSAFRCLLHIPPLRKGCRG